MFNLKSSTKVIIKFQIFSVAILVIFLFVLNVLFFEIGLKHFDDRIERIKHSNAYKYGYGIGLNRNWHIVDKNDCFVMYNNKFCLNSGNNLIGDVYKIGDFYFYLKDNVVLDISDFMTSYVNLIKISFILILIYILSSYFIGRIFLQTIYKKIYMAINDLEEKNYIDIERMKLVEGDELKILFDEINKQIRTISSFNKYLSHELKTPLMRVLSKLDILSLKVNDEDINSMKKEILLIKDIIDSLNKLILLETKRYKLKKEEVDICFLIDKMSKDLKLDIELNCKIKKIFTSKELFGIIIKNLLENAKKYSKGKIYILVDRNFILFKNRSEEIKNIDKLTEMFYKEGKDGLGIGLYLVRRICEILGYKLFIDYKDGWFLVKILFN